MVAVLPEASYPARIALPFEYIPGQPLEIEMPVTDADNVAVDWTGVGTFTGVLRPSAAPPYSPDAALRLPITVTVPTPANGVVVMTVPDDITNVMDGPSRQLWEGLLTLTPTSGGSPMLFLEFTLQRRGGIWGAR